MDQWTTEGAMDGAMNGLEAIEGTMDCASGGWIREFRRSDE